MQFGFQMCFCLPHILSKVLPVDPILITSELFNMQYSFIGYLKAKDRNYRQT